MGAIAAGERAALDRDDDRDVRSPAHAHPTAGLLIDDDARRDTTLPFLGAIDIDAKARVTKPLDRRITALPDDPRRCQEPSRRAGRDAADPAALNGHTLRRMRLPGPDREGDAVATPGVAELLDSARLVRWDRVVDLGETASSPLPCLLERHQVRRAHEYLSHERPLSRRRADQEVVRDSEVGVDLPVRAGTDDRAQVNSIERVPLRRTEPRNRACQLLDAQRSRPIGGWPSRAAATCQRKGAEAQHDQRGSRSHLLDYRHGESADRVDRVLRIGSIVLRVDDLQRQAEFWEAALDYVRRDDATSDDFVLLGPRDGVGPNLSLDNVPSKVQIPPRLHFDLYTRNQQAEVERLKALGATEVHWDKRPPDADYVILADPEGNRFCVVDAGSGDSDPDVLSSEWPTTSRR